MNIRNDDDHTNSLVLLNCNLLCFETLIPIWIDIEWHAVNAQTIIYKIKSNPIVLIFKISQRHKIVEQLSLSFEKTNLKNFEQIKFVGDEYLVYQHKKGSNRLIYCYNFSNNTLRFRLKINQVALFDNGNAMLVKVLDKLEFVVFFLKSKTKNIEENTIHFDNFRLHNSTTVLTLKKNTFYQFCRSFSFIHYANEFKIVHNVQIFNMMVSL
jgi:hypothetical protein